MESEGDFHLGGSRDLRYSLPLRISMGCSVGMGNQEIISLHLTDDFNHKLLSIIHCLSAKTFQMGHYRLRRFVLRREKNLHA